MRKMIVPLLASIIFGVPFIATAQTSSSASAPTTPGFSKECTSYSKSQTKGYMWEI